MTMNDNTEILIRLGRIEGQLTEVLKISERVRLLELWQAWLKGGWAALVGGYLYLFKAASAK
jgi:hypothetical protein